MTDLEDAVDDFLDRADRVYDDYESGYVDPDAALSALEGHLASLREAAGDGTGETRTRD